MVPLRFLLSGAVALAAFWTALVLRPSAAVGYAAAPDTLALVHVLTLGVGTLVLVGAMHQLVPVLLVTHLYAPGWGLATFLGLGVGSLAVVLGFALGSRPAWLAVGGTVAWLAVTLFVLNVGLTAARVARLDAPAVTLLVATAYLWLTFTLGTLLALARVWPALQAALGYATPVHLSFGLLGAFGLAIAGAGHKLLSMFTLAHGVRLGALWGVLGFTVAGTVLLVVVTWGPAVGFGGGPGALTYAASWGARLAFLFGGACYALDVRRILRARIRRNPDVGVRGFLVGIAGFVPAAAAMLAGRIDVAVTLVLVGVVPLAIAGMLVKISTFLTWQHRYARWVGRSQTGRGTPMLSDMIRPRLGWVTIMGLAAGSLLVALARLLDSEAVAGIAAVLGAVGAWALLAHVAWIVFAEHAPSGAQGTPPAPPVERRQDVRPS
ncbi:MAG: hypothetical protein U5K81_11595 [Trueperaceae bacterium]|nr:hypothetical protein [Trueperaceae bacterium]